MSLIGRSEAELLRVGEDDPAMRAMATAKARGCLVNVNDAEAILVGSGLPNNLRGAVEARAILAEADREVVRSGWTEEAVAYIERALAALRGSRPSGGSSRMNVLAHWWLIVGEDGHAFEVRNEQPGAVVHAHAPFNDRVVEVVPADQLRGAVEALETIARLASTPMTPGRTRATLEQVAAIARNATGGQ